MTGFYSLNVRKFEILSFKLKVATEKKTVKFRGRFHNIGSTYFLFTVKTTITTTTMKSTVRNSMDPYKVQKLFSTNP